MGLPEGCFEPSVIPQMALGKYWGSQRFKWKCKTFVSNEIEVEVKFFKAFGPADSKAIATSPVPSIPIPISLRHYC